MIRSPVIIDAEISLNALPLAPTTATGTTTKSKSHISRHDKVDTHGVTYAKVVERMRKTGINEKMVTADKRVPATLVSRIFTSILQGDRKGGLTIGLILGIGLGVLLVLSLDNFSPPIDPYSSDHSGCDGTTFNCVEGRVQTPDRWYWARRIFSLEDTLAQWVMTAFTVLAAFLLLGTLKATQAMANDTREIGEAQVRAYLAVHDVTISMDAQSGEVFIRGNVKNTGNSPAIDIEVGVRVMQKPEANVFVVKETIEGVENISAGESEGFLAAVKGDFRWPEGAKQRFIVAITAYGYDVFGNEIEEPCSFISDDDGINTKKPLVKFFGRIDGAVTLTFNESDGIRRKKKRQT